MTPGDPGGDLGDLGLMRYREIECRKLIRCDLDINSDSETCLKF